jgi:hypothetical protein
VTGRTTSAVQQALFIDTPSASVKPSSDPSVSLSPAEGLLEHWI